MSFWVWFFCCCVLSMNTLILKLFKVKPQDKHPYLHCLLIVQNGEAKSKYQNITARTKCFVLVSQLRTSIPCMSSYFGISRLPDFHSHVFHTRIWHTNAHEQLHRCSPISQESTESTLHCKSWHLNFQL